eukprot:6621014-Prymnesium_polylepis.1
MGLTVRPSLRDFGVEATILDESRGGVADDVAELDCSPGRRLLMNHRDLDTVIEHPLYLCRATLAGELSMHAGKSSGHSCDRHGG